MSVAVITGAASGIGAGLAREAVHRGMDVVLADLDAAALEAVATEIGGKTIAQACDVTSLMDMQLLAEEAFRVFGQVDLLFNNAGILRTGLTWDIDPEDWNKVLNVNIMGIVNSLHAFVPKMLATDISSRIINTASVGGFLPSPFMAPYSATKFAIVALTEALAGELKASGSRINVSLLAPGPVKSRIFEAKPRASSQEFHAAMTAMLDTNGLTPDEFSPLVFDAIDRGDYWIIPQPEMFEEGFRSRNRMIEERSLPIFYSVERE